MLRAASLLLQCFQFIKSNDCGGAVSSGGDFVHDLVLLVLIFVANKTTQVDFSVPHYFSELQGVFYSFRTSQKLDPERLFSAIQSNSTLPLPFLGTEVFRNIP